MADPDAFLTRWSRLKRKARAEARDGAARPGAARPQPAESTLPAEAVPPSAPKPAPELPPIDSLGRDSDYTPFMRVDVPDALRNQALRKLWQSDPVFANLDGLVEYGEDFGAPFKLGGAVATVYRVLEGMPQPAEEKEPGQPNDRPADAAAAARESPPARLDVAGGASGSQAREQKQDVKAEEDVESHKAAELD